MALKQNPFEVPLNQSETKFIFSLCTRIAKMWLAKMYIAKIIAKMWLTPNVFSKAFKNHQTLKNSGEKFDEVH